VLVEATGRIMARVSAKMGVYTVKCWRKRGIEVYLEPGEDVENGSDADDGTSSTRAR